MYYTRFTAVEADEFKGSLKGDVTGSFTGDLVGDVTGTVTGGLIGNVLGNVSGNLAGNVTGNLTGDVTGDVTGNLTGNVTGNVTGNTAGTHTGAFVGAHTGLSYASSNYLHPEDQAGLYAGITFTASGQAFQTRLATGQLMFVRNEGDTNSFTLKNIASGNSITLGPGELALVIGGTDTTDSIFIKLVEAE